MGTASRAQRRRAGGTHRVALTMALSVLAGCLGRADGAFETITPERSPIRVHHPDFDPDRAVHSVHRSPANGNVWYVAEVNGAQAFGAVVASRLQPGREAIAQPTQAWIRGIIGPEYRLAWGTSGETATSAGPITYRLFRMGDVRGPLFTCVGFSQRRGPPPDDGRPPNVVYGYFCLDGARPLDPALAEGMLASLEVTTAA